MTANVIARSGLAIAKSRICAPLYDYEPLRWRVWLTGRAEEEGGEGVDFYLLSW